METVRRIHHVIRSCFTDLLPLIANKKNESKNTPSGNDELLRHSLHHYASSSQILCSSVCSTAVVGLVSRGGGDAHEQRRHFFTSSRTRSSSLSTTRGGIHPRFAEGAAELTAPCFGTSRKRKEREAIKNLSESAQVAATEKAMSPPGSDEEDEKEWKPIGQSSYGFIDKPPQFRYWKDFVGELRRYELRWQYSLMGGGGGGGHGGGGGNRRTTTPFLTSMRLVDRGHNMCYVDGEREVFRPFPELHHLTLNSDISGCIGGSSSSGGGSSQQQQHYPPLRTEPMIELLQATARMLMTDENCCAVELMDSIPPPPSSHHDSQHRHFKLLIDRKVVAKPKESICPVTNYLVNQRVGSTVTVRLQDMRHGEGGGSGNVRSSSPAAAAAAGGGTIYPVMENVSLAAFCYIQLNAIPVLMARVDLPGGKPNHCHFHSEDMMQLRMGWTMVRKQIRMTPMDLEQFDLILPPPSSSSS